MRTLSAGLMAAVLLAVGCGDGDRPAPAPPPEEPAPGGDGGDPTTPGSPGPGDPGSPGPGEPGAPPSEPDRFVTVERLDSNPECDTLIPTRVPVPVTVHLDVSPASAGCGTHSVSEGTGHVALSVQGGRGFVVWQVFSADGRPEQQMTLHGGFLLPQPEGWQGARASGTGSIPVSMNLVLNVLSFFGDGSPRRSETPAPAFEARTWRLAEDPLGGSLLVLTGLALDATRRCVSEVRRYDVGGAPRGAPVGVGCSPLAGVSNRGETLVLDLTGGRSIVRWLDADGSAARPANDEGDVGSISGRLVPLLDGSLALTSGPEWTRRYPHLADRGEPAPAWLTARNGQSFRFTRGNAGYAFFPSPGRASADCTQAVELLAPSGRRCARLTFREDATDCDTGSIDQGWDGTVVQQSGKDPCTYRWWPALLAR